MAQSLTLDTLRLAASLEHALEGLQAASGLNVTQALILVALHSDVPPHKKGWFRHAATAEAMTELVGCGRTGIAMQLRALLRRKLVRPFEPSAGDREQWIEHGFDNRSRLYELTAMGVTMATRVHEEFIQWDAVLRTLMTAKGREAVSKAFKPMKAAVDALRAMPRQEGVFENRIEAWRCESERRRQRKRTR